MSFTKTRLEGALEARRRARSIETRTGASRSLHRFLRKAHEALGAGSDPKAVDIAARLYVNEDLRNRVNSIVVRTLRNQATGRSRQRPDRLNRLSER